MPSNTLPSSSAHPMHTRSKGRRKRQARQERKLNDVTKKLAKNVPVKTLRHLAQCAKKALTGIKSDSFKLPVAALKIMADRLDSRRLNDLTDLGKSYLSYAIVTILRQRLPSKIVSRGSLTVIRATIISQARMLTLTSKAQAGNGTHTRTEAFLASVGLLAESGSENNVFDFVSLALDPVFHAVCSRGRLLGSLHGHAVFTDDRTRNVLGNIQARSERTKRRHHPSSGKKNRPLLVNPCESEIGDSTIVAADTDGRQPDGRQRDVQNAIIIVLLKLAPALAFPELSKYGPVVKKAWGILLGDPSGRDPFETCGDAAMHVVVTELLLDRLTGCKEGLAIRRCIPVNSPYAKAAGNALEVFAGALASYRSLEVLKTWADHFYRTLIPVAIEAWLAHGSESYV
ncbi:hypothetical protein C8R44DRAFT_739339 [Mycena epipterygia]|nr:hypothetical protein C8R44DRAFT_739339 [Mycena epipterygia]